MGTRAAGAGSGSRSVVPRLLQQEVRPEAVHTTAEAALERSPGAHGAPVLRHRKARKVVSIRRRSRPGVYLIFINQVEELQHNAATLLLNFGNQFWHLCIVVIPLHCRLQLHRLAP